jgi:hypothetical protein
MGAGRPATTQPLTPYAAALLRWFRFTWAADNPRDQATRSEARDFCRYLQIAGMPRGSAGRHDKTPFLYGRQPAQVQRPGAGKLPSQPGGCEEDGYWTPAGAWASVSTTLREIHDVARTGRETQATPARARPLTAGGIRLLPPGRVLCCAPRRPGAPMKYAYSRT